ncbi:ATP-dependent Clp protease adapter ClpS [Pelagibacterium flavum]|uniref:ATP-dependent Clp protease adapter protein ClpS n=1 Tax=Pelagibacterium flavum TaxID=2984530 RepID=A0ABY6IXA8_9HYPH|nr:ATP-dependent Clp protease adapter ClpS [Pelagibacterium sp. YIM 151497]UYQ73992.1 ATP-dependent Clp protease adapter ClpS [Pelagibacterium sp. YIM 151497]
MSAPSTGLELPHGGGVCARRDTLPAISAGPGDDDNKRDEGAGQTGVATKTRTKTKKPSLYRVLLLNDDYTPMEFVILILEEVFNKSREDATRIMLSVHNQGVGECGVYPYEVAETKVTNVMDAARRNQHPLQCVMEKQ